MSDQKRETIPEMARRMFPTDVPHHYMNNDGVKPIAGAPPLNLLEQNAKQRAGLNTPVLANVAQPSGGFINTPPQPLLGAGHDFGYWPKLNDVVQAMAGRQAESVHPALVPDCIGWLRERVARLEQENATLRAQNPGVKAILDGVRDLLAAEANDPDSLEKQVDNVLRGIQQNKVIPRQVDDLHSATTKSKQDRAVGRAIKTV